MSFANIDVDDIFIINEYNMIYHLASGISARCNLRGLENESMRIMVALGPEQKQAMEKGLNDSGYVLCRNCAKNS